LYSDNSHPAVALPDVPLHPASFYFHAVVLTTGTKLCREIQSTSRKAKQSYQPAEGSQQSFALSYRNIAGSLWPGSALPAWDREAFFFACDARTLQRLKIFADDALQ